MTESHKILSIDLGSTLGYAVIDNGIIRESGTLNLWRKDAHPGDRFLRFNNWIIDILEKNDIDEIFYEDVPRFESAKSARVYCGLLSLVQMLALSMGKRMTNIKPGTVKKEFAGHGHADKFDICRTAHRCGWKHGHAETDIDHDEADAIAVAWVILKRREVEPRFA